MPDTPIPPAAAAAFAAQPGTPEPSPSMRLVFVYGSLRAGGSNDIRRFAPAPEWVAEGSIAGVLYDLGAYPGVRLGGATRVVGEVYRVSAGVEAALDELEEVDGETGEYQRRFTPVEAGDQRLVCLVYEIHPSRIEGCGVIASGDWIAF